MQSTTSNKRSYRTNGLVQDELAALLDSGVASIIEGFLDALSPQQTRDYLLEHWKQAHDDGLMYDHGADSHLRFSDGS